MIASLWKENIVSRKVYYTNDFETLERYWIARNAYYTYDFDAYKNLSHKQSLLLFDSLRNFWQKSVANKNSLDFEKIKFSSKIRFWNDSFVDMNSALDIPSFQKINRIIRIRWTGFIPFWDSITGQPRSFCSSMRLWVLKIFIRYCLARRSWDNLPKNELFNRPPRTRDKNVESTA